MYDFKDSIKEGLKFITSRLAKIGFNLKSSSPICFEANLYEAMTNFENRLIISKDATHILKNGCYVDDSNIIIN